MLPSYDLDKIKFVTDKATFERAVEIYDSDGVKDFEDVDFGYSARVRGSKGNFLEEYAKLDPACIKTFGKLKDRETCFGWEEPLLQLLV